MSGVAAESSETLAAIVRGYRPKYFALRELVPPEVFDLRGASAWELLDPRVLLTADALRERFGPCTVNDWANDGNYHESGLRSFTTKTGARFSQHRFGRALDCKFANATPREVFDYVLAHATEFPYITVLEDVVATPSWVHFDVRAASWDGIRVVKP